MIIRNIFTGLCCLLIAGIAHAFTYQGELSQSGTAFNGEADIRFTLYDAATGGAVKGVVDLRSNVVISNGRFVVELDQWDAQLDGTPLWLEIAAAIPAGGSLTTLEPRQKIDPAPYAKFAYKGASDADLSAHQANESAHHSPVVTTTEIADGTILPDDLNQSKNFRFYGLINNGGDVNFYDTTHAMRWKDYTGASQRAWIYTSVDLWKFEHTMYSGRDILVSNANGIGIGTDAPASTHAVTMPSLNVTGNLEIGLEIVTANYDVTASTSCPSFGGGTCYYGAGSASCPVGKKVLGGGAFASNSAWGEITSSYPGTTAWYCASTYDLSKTTTCYAICARLE